MSFNLLCPAASEHPRLVTHLLQDAPASFQNRILDLHGVTPWATAKVPGHIGIPVARCEGYRDDGLDHRRKIGDIVNPYRGRRLSAHHRVMETCS